MSRARSGDGEAFRELTEPYRRELHVHCYRMLGSLQDAEDALQETMLSAWQALSGFEERASVRTWLYRIATNRCLNLRRSTGRRAAREWNVPGVEPLEPTRLGEVVWLQPYPDALFDHESAPEARVERTESISLAFIKALQALPPRQLAVLVLREVLGFHAAEVAQMLDTTTESVTSALKRARATMQRERQAPQATAANDRPAKDRAAKDRAAKDRAAKDRAAKDEEEIVGRFVSAYEAADLDGLVALLTDDAFISMPPMPLEYEGRDLVIRFFANIFGAGRRFDLIPARANGQPALGMYLRDPGGMSHGVGFIVLTLRGDRISAMTRFENTVLPWFGLPRSLPSK